MSVVEVENTTRREILSWESDRKYPDELDKDLITRDEDFIRVKTSLGVRGKICWAAKVESLHGNLSYGIM